MTTTSPIESYRDGVAPLTVAVFEAMLGLAVEPLPAPPEHFDPAFAAAVHYQGAWRGSLVLECNEQQARSWAQALMSLPSVEDNDARDALAEIANVLAGNLKSVFPSGAVLSMPAVVAPPSPDMNQGATSEKAYFADQSGVFSVTFVDAG